MISALVASHGELYLRCRQGDKYRETVAAEIPASCDWFDSSYPHVPAEKAPYGRDGSLQHYPTSWWVLTGKSYEDRFGATIPEHRSEGPDWKPVEPFEAILILDGLARGRSAAYFWWHDNTRRKYPMFMKEMVDVVKRGTINKGVVSGIWTVYKRGQNYGIGLVK